MVTALVVVLGLIVAAVIGMGAFFMWAAVSIFTLFAKGIYFLFIIYIICRIFRGVFRPRRRHDNRYNSPRSIQPYRNRRDRW
jgi:hypothetical protein